MFFPLKVDGLFWKGLVIGNSAQTPKLMSEDTFSDFWLNINELNILNAFLNSFMLYIWLNFFYILTLILHYRSYFILYILSIYLYFIYVTIY